MSTCLAFAISPLPALVINLFFLHKCCTSWPFFSAGALIFAACPAPGGAGVSSCCSLLSFLPQQAPAFQEIAMPAKQQPHTSAGRNRDVCEGSRARAMLGTASHTYCLTPVVLMLGWWNGGPANARPILCIWLSLPILKSILCFRKAGSFLSRHTESINFSLQTPLWLKAVSVPPSPALHLLPLLTVGSVLPLWVQSMLCFVTFMQNVIRSVALSFISVSGKLSDSLKTDEKHRKGAW